MEELLAIKLRPNKLSDIIGQKHLIGENKVLTNLVKNKKLFSMILYGPPGIGKTSIANALANEMNMKFRSLNAVINNKKDFDTVVEEAKYFNGMILLMDEIHRLNKDKQDLLLPYLETGLITLIGMTTSNPYHAINKAIRSRCQIYELKPLDDEDLSIAIDKVIESKLLSGLEIEDDAKNEIIRISGSDLRYVYNLIEVCYYSNDDKKITVDKLKNLNTKININHDKDEDDYYDLLSAFQKSIRGSDPDAAVYYLARLLEGNEIESVCRRMTVIAYEDIGLANPSMGPKVDAAVRAVERLGLPEGRIPLASVVIELALSPKSNSAESAINAAFNDINSFNTGKVPNHIKNNSHDYKYPHNYKNSFVKQQYLPDRIKDRKYYIPKNNQNENKLKQILDNLDKLKNI